MAGIVVSASKGVMESVLAKLTALTGDKCANLMSVPNDVLFLREELSEMNAVLEKLEDTDELDDPQVKNWRNQVREMTYDIEDSIDYFMNNVGSADAKAGLMEKASHFVTTLRERWEAAKLMKQLKTRLQEINDRRKRYKVECCSSSALIQTLDPRLPALYSEASSLVGIENPKEDLIKMVMHGDPRLKVISVVGSGGLGKTTLANEVYREIGGQFDCKVFVSISRTPDMTRILSDVLDQLGKYPTSRICDVKYLINSLREYLHEKRYLIVVDDLWDEASWNTIRCAFLPNNHRSRVVVTTRDMEVARACCHDRQYIYEMQPLSVPNSKKLFFKRLYISEDPGDSNKVLGEILKKCGGLPLAIITVASILACQQPNIRLKEQWESIQNSLADQSAANPNLEDMVHILELSYKSLPRYLRTCFLYLGKYPEDHKIERDDLVRQWVAEGFVSNSPGRDVWHVAEGYFNMLVNRSMVQPVYDAYNTEVRFCRVHDMMLDLILRRCREDSLITVTRDPHEVGKGQYKVRRVSFDLSVSVDGTMPETSTSQLSKARSIAIFGGSKRMPPFLEFKCLRVLFLEIHRCIRRIDLTSIIQLSQLRYMKIECHTFILGGRSIELPSKIGRLQHLETMEFLVGGDCCRFPSDVIDLPRLSHLDVSSWGTTRLPDRIGKMKSLRTLRGFSLAMSSLETIEDLEHLCNMEDLDLYVLNDSAPLAWMDALSSCLGKLSNLKRLCLSASKCWRGEALSSLSPTFLNLERLSLNKVIFSRIPRWIRDLHEVRSLSLVVDEISNSSWQDIGIIGALRSLVELRLRVRCVPAERIVIAGSTGFATLQEFGFNCDGISYLAFEAGAMPNLRSLVLHFDPHVWDKAPPNGLHHLSSLKRITAWRVATFPRGESREEINKMTAAVIREVLGGAADALPTRPTFHISEEAWTRRGS